MADMTATGWDPAGAVVIMQSMRPWGPRAERRALVQLNFKPSWFGSGVAAFCYPSDGIPAPAPARVGFRENIQYIIPLSPFMHAANGPTTFGKKVFPWGCFPPTFSATGTTASQSICHIRIVGGVPVPTAAAGANASFVGSRSFLNELITDHTPTSLVSDGDTLTAYAIFVGK